MSSHTNRLFSRTSYSRNSTCYSKSSSHRKPTRGRLLITSALYKEESNGTLTVAQQVALSASCLCLGAAALAPISYASVQGINSEVPVYDGAKILSAERRQSIEDKLKDLESRTGWRVRVLTNYGDITSNDFGTVRSTWKPDKDTVVLQFDPSSPNIISFDYIGDNALMTLRRPFWIELQARFGNLFYVRDEGEAASVMAVVDAVTRCLQERCLVVPGIPEEQYYYTLGCSIVAGTIAGFVSRLEPQGFVQRKWVWLLIFSPLWASIFVNFGLGPIITRTSDVGPLVANTAAFLGTFSVFIILPKLLRPREQEQQ